MGVPARLPEPIWAPVAFRRWGSLGSNMLASEPWLLWRPAPSAAYNYLICHISDHFLSFLIHHDGRTLQQHLFKLCHPVAEHISPTSILEVRASVPDDMPLALTGVISSHTRHARSLLHHLLTRLTRPKTRSRILSPREKKVRPRTPYCTCSNAPSICCPCTAILEKFLELPQHSETRA